MQLIDLSHVIAPGMSQWPGDDQPLNLHRRSEHGPDGHMSSSLEIGCHVGTHLDAALHFLEGQPALDKIPVDRFSGAALVVEALQECTTEGSPLALSANLLNHHDLSKVDFVLFHTGWDSRWGSDEYYRHWPWLSSDLARLLSNSELKGVGVDTPSLDNFGGSIAHDLCAAADMVNIENLTGLKPLVNSVVNFMALPLKLHKTEASPVRAVAWR